MGNSWGGGDSFAMERGKEERVGGHLLHDAVVESSTIFRAMDAPRRDLIQQRWHTIQNELLPERKLDLGSTTPKLERLMIDRTLWPISGFPRYRKLPSEATFSRTFEEYATTTLAERVHEALIKTHLADRPISRSADQPIGHIGRDGMAIEGRALPVRGAETTAAKEPRTVSRCGQWPKECTERLRAPA